RDFSSSGGRRSLIRGWQRNKPAALLNPLVRVHVAQRNGDGNSVLPIDPAVLPARSLHASPQRTRNATSLLPDLELANKRHAHRRLEIPSCHRNPGGSRALTL